LTILTKRNFSKHE